MLPLLYLNLKGNNVASQKLTPKQRLFIKHYIANGGNGTQAAISAGYSKSTAHTQANENLKKPYIVKHLQRMVKVKEEPLDVSAAQTIKSIREIANDKEEPSAVRLRALELLGKTQRIFVERHEVDHGLKLSNEIEEIFSSLCVLVKLKRERG